MVNTGDLVEEFALHLPAEARGRVGRTRELATVLAALLDAARSAWPSVELERRAFLAYLADRIDCSRAPIEALHALRVGDLFVACACANGDEQALRAFDAHFAPESTAR